jgi:hypothetical protein
MSAPQRLLIVGGLLLALVGMSYGLWYAVFVEHQTLEHIGGALAAGFSQAAARNLPQARAAFQEYGEAQYDYVRQVDVHSHCIGLAMLLIVFGALFDRVAFGERVRLWLASGFVMGAVLFPLGVFLQTMDHGSLPRAITIIGSALVIAALAGSFLGLARESAG